jgi:hypothetical protein
VFFNVFVLKREQKGKGKSFIKQMFSYLHKQTVNKKLNDIH